jgi:hypothetical protein
VTETRPIAFVETLVFTRRITTLGLEEPLRELQLDLLRNPEAGPWIREPVAFGRSGSRIRAAARASGAAHESTIFGSQRCRSST